MFGFIGSHQTIGLVAVLLIVISWLVAPRIHTGKRALVSAVLVLTALTPVASFPGIIGIDTASAHYEVISAFRNDRPITGLITGPSGTQSAVYQNGLSDPVFWYAQQVSRLTIDRQPESILVLGGGAFTLPQYLSEQLPNAEIDVVEIDPELETISQQYFRYQNPSSVNELFTDARTYVNQTERRYDVVIVDVYGDTSIPFTFMTKEYGKAVAGILKNDGIVIANIIGGQTGECRGALGAVDAAYRSQLPNAQYVNESGRPEDRANYIVVYSEHPQPVAGLRELPPFESPLYTDNFAPAERLYYECRLAMEQ